MKITILSTAYPYRGGIADFTGLLSQFLSENNTVQIINLKRQYPNFLFPGKTQFEPEKNKNDIDLNNSVDTLNPFNWIRIGKKIKKDEPDLLIFNYWMPFFAPCFAKIASIARRNYKTKVLVICHNIIPHERNPGDTMLAKYFFKNANYFITLSKEVNDVLLKIIPEAEHKVLQHPVYSNFGESIDKEKAKEFLNIKEENIILFFGFIRDYKGLDILLKAMPIIKEKLNIKLLIAGEYYSNEEYYKNLIEELGLEDSLYLINNFIPKEEVKYYFSASDLVVLPYKSATQSGIAQIAINFKKPVVATDVGGLAEVVVDGKNGYVVEKENPKSLAEAVIKFYEEKKEEEFSQYNDKEVKKYSWEFFTDELIQLTE